MGYVAVSMYQMQGSVIGVEARLEVTKSNNIHAFILLMLSREPNSLLVAISKQSYNFTTKHSS